MASNKAAASTALLLSLNLLLFSMVSSTILHHHHPLPTCPTDALKLGVCANILGLGGIHIGSPPTQPCCSLIDGLVDLEAAVCLCTAIKLNILVINIDIPIALSLILNNCGKRVPSGFECSNTL